MTTDFWCVHCCNTTWISQVFRNGCGTLFWEYSAGEYFAQTARKPCTLRPVEGIFIFFRRALGEGHCNGCATGSKVPQITLAALSGTPGHTPRSMRGQVWAACSTTTARSCAQHRRGSRFGELTNAQLQGGRASLITHVPPPYDLDTRLCSSAYTPMQIRTGSHTDLQ